MYQLIGSEASTYSVKVRSYLTCKDLPFSWMTRHEAKKLFEQHARLPRLPLLVTPDGAGIHYSTAIIQHVEEAHPAPAAQPEDPTSRFMCALLEEFADEWASRWVEHYRWAREADSAAFAKRLAELASPTATDSALAEQIREQMLAPAWYQAPSPAQAKVMESSFKDSLDLLELHLKQHAYLFGARPSIADFALGAQLAAAHQGPTPGDIIEMQAPHTVAWLGRLEQLDGVAADTDYLPWANLADTLGPLIRDQVGGLFLPWSVANARALANATRSFTAQLRAESWSQPTQRYAAASYQELRERYQQTPDHDSLNDALSSHSCLGWLTA